MELDEDYAETIPTLDDWLDRWEAAVVAGQTTIGREEAERRYFDQYPEVDYWRDRG